MREIFLFPKTLIPQDYLNLKDENNFRNLFSLDQSSTHVFVTFFYSTNKKIKKNSELLTLLLKITDTHNATSSKN